MKFHQIITDFRKKLDSAKDNESVSKAEIDVFYSKINSMKLTYVLFPKYYRKYIANLNRLKPHADDTNPDLSLLKVALTENEWKPTKPLDIFIHHLKYENALTSKFFIARQKKQNRKKINSPEAKVIQNDKPKSSKEWTRVPIGRIPPTKKR